MRRAPIPPSLLISVKNYLDITWQDEALDHKLQGIIARGIGYLDDAAGVSLDYEEEGKPRELLFDYVRYARADALSEFLPNYLHEILFLQNTEKAVRALAEQESNANVQ